MYFSFKNTYASGSNESGNNKSLTEAQQAIRRSKEILEQAEQAMTRSYAVVELSKNFINSFELNDTNKSGG